MTVVWLAVKYPLGIRLIVINLAANMIFNMIMRFLTIATVVTRKNSNTSLSDRIAPGSSPRAIMTSSLPGLMFCIQTSS